MNQKKKNPGAGGAARGADGFPSGSAPKYMPARKAAQRAWDACAAARAAEAAEKKQAAGQVRAVAQKLGAELVITHDRWRLTCPCGVTTFIDAITGSVSASASSCEATSEIKQFVSDRLHRRQQS